MAVTFSQKVFDTICERIAEGESLRAICKDEDMPSKTSVMKWLAEDTKLADQYARARQDQADHYVDEIIAISDNSEDPQKARLQVDTRKWIASKLLPKVYGDRINHDVEGGVEVVVTHHYPET